MAWKIEHDIYCMYQFLHSSGWSCRKRLTHVRGSYKLIGLVTTNFRSFATRWFFWKDSAGFHLDQKNQNASISICFENRLSLALISMRIPRDRGWLRTAPHYRQAIVRYQVRVSVIEKMDGGDGSCHICWSAVDLGPKPAWLLITL